MPIGTTVHERTHYPKRNILVLRKDVSHVFKSFTLAQHLSTVVTFAMSRLVVVVIVLGVLQEKVAAQQACTSTSFAQRGYYRCAVEHTDTSESDVYP